MPQDPKHPRRGWYVVQVTPGAEDRMCALIKRACEDFDDRMTSESNCIAMKECFSPKFESRKKRMGQWYSVSRALLPGYVVVDTRNPAALQQVLASLREFARVLAGDETYSPLDEAERKWLEAQSGEGERTIPLSFGYREGDKLVVTSGPLKGHEARITKVDRKNCLAHVEFHAGPISFKTTVGLVVMPNGKVVQAG